MSKSVRGLAFILSLAMLCSAGLTGCGKKEKKTENKEVSSVSSKEVSGNETETSSIITEDNNSDVDSVISSSESESTETVTPEVIKPEQKIINKKIEPLTAEYDYMLFRNPDRGFRTHMYFNIPKLAEMSKAERYKSMDAHYRVFCNKDVDKTDNLVMVYMYFVDYDELKSVKGYIGKDLPPIAFTIMEEIFDIFRERKKKMMFRVTYSGDWQRPETCADQETILRHIDQLAPFIAKNKDVIFDIECGFVGAYGEWASDYQKPPVDYATVIRAITEKLCIPNGLFFSIRLPSYKNFIPSDDPIYKWIAHNNDAMYGEQAHEGWHSGGYQFGTPEWAQVSRQGAYTPQGGEMNTNYAMLRNGCIPTGIEMIKETAHHWHYTMSNWHCMYDDREKAIMNKWRVEEITPEILEQHSVVYCPSWFIDKNGKKVKRNAYDFLRDHLGYKIEAQALKIEGDLKAGKKVNAELDIKNYGMAAAFGIESGFAILDSNYKPVTRIKAGAPDKWYSHNPEDFLDTSVLTHKVKTQLNLPQKSGKYYIAFYMENSLECSAMLSNKISYKNGYNILASFNI